MGQIQGSCWGGAGACRGANGEGFHQGPGTDFSTPAQHRAGAAREVMCSSSVFCVVVVNRNYAAVQSIHSIQCALHAGSCLGWEVSARRVGRWDVN